VARSLVEDFLGQLEGQGYLADRLELRCSINSWPLRSPTTAAWIYPGGTAEKTSGLVAWWYGGTLRNLGLIHLPAGERRSAVLNEQLAQMTWAAELEGWLTSSPRWHLVADDATAAAWQPIFNQSLDQPLEIVAPLPPVELAAPDCQTVGPGPSPTRT